MDFVGDALLLVTNWGEFCCIAAHWLSQGIWQYTQKHKLLHANGIRIPDKQKLVKLLENMYKDTLAKGLTKEGVSEAFLILIHWQFLKLE